MRTEGNTLIAEGGMVLRRKATGEVFGESAVLGYSHYIGGVRQKPPHKDTADDFEEVWPDEEIGADEALAIIMGGRSDE